MLALQSYRHRVDMLTLLGFRCNNVLWIKKNDQKGVENGMEE